MERREIKFLLQDTLSLISYSKGKSNSVEDIKRRMMLLGRQTNPTWTDHHYLLQQEFTFENYPDHVLLPEFLCRVVSQLSDDYLELREDKVYVCQEKQVDWQQLICSFSPLLLVADCLRKKQNFDINRENEVVDFYRKQLYPNCCYTALVPTYVPELEYWVKEKKGLHDLHIHLNGTVEADQVWLNLIGNPYINYQYIEKVYKNDKMVKEHFESECNGLTPFDLYKYFKIAHRIRTLLFAYIYHTENSEACKLITENRSPIHLALDIESKDCFSKTGHPFAKLVGRDANEPLGLMPVEALMYVLVLKYCARNPDKEIVGQLFHFYLLILGLANRLLVQQPHQFGFREFQKITKNNIRQNAEAVYKTRFFQLSGNHTTNIAFIEGRFSPQKTENENAKQLSLIANGWNSFQSKSTNKGKLCLTAHFIKKEDKENNESFVRHSSLRKELNQKASVLAYMKNSSLPNINLLAGIDAASSEFDAPPEVFAPAYRMLRHAGFKHFTFHAGEDFYHIIGGLRAVYEAIEFLDLSYGDRIGHSVATGTNADCWLAHVGSKILIRKGDYMSDLIFAYKMITNKERPINVLMPLAPIISNRIQELSDDIFQEDFTMSSQLAAWEMRKLCPFVLFSLFKNKCVDSFKTPFMATLDDAKESDLYNEEESCMIKEIVDKSNKQSIKLLQLYHSCDFKKNYNKIIEIDSQEIFDAKAIQLLQLAVLELMHRKEIVIETLPTSNLRIGFYSEYGFYHLWNWKKWEDEGYCIPPIVMGTDDAGIFATNIYNEYANVYCHLVHECKMSHNKAIDILLKMDKNAEIYRFE